MPNDTQPAARPDLSSFGSVINHHVMLRDRVRVEAYREAIARHAPGKTVLDVGCGSGILSLFAALAGAKRVIAIEQTPIADLARDLFRANGVADRVELKVANSADVVLAEPVDVIVHELIGYIDPFEEGILPTLSDATKRLMAAGGRLIPHRLEVGCVGYEAHESPFLEQDSSLREARELETAYGLNLAPLVERLRVLPERYFLRRLPNRIDPTGRVLTEEATLFGLDLGKAGHETRPAEMTVSVRATTDGTLAGFFVFFRAHLDETLRLTNSPFAPQTHWCRGNVDLVPPLPVRAGEERRFLFRYEFPFGDDALLTAQAL